MKKLLISFGFLLACVCAWAQGIGSYSDLQAFIEACNKGESIIQWCNSDTVVVLTADIDMAKAKKFVPVKSFSGHFDGQSHRLKNWKAQRGLFSEITKRGVVEGIIIDASCSLNATSKGEEFYAGFIADKNYGLIKGCINYGKISHKCGYALSNNNIGGIAGYNRYAILNCSNYGEISSDVSGVNKEEVFIAVGGIAGGGAGKPKYASVIAHCNNEGAIKVIANLASIYAGGICGNASRSSLKYCDNRGKISADIRAAEDGSTKGIAKVGGIAAQTKNHILRCYNYGALNAAGECGANIGGIVGIPHESLVIADCINYGPVKAEGEQPSNVGGIVGSIGRPVHVRGCTNYGEIRFDGVSSRARSTAAGIVGNIYCPKSQKAGAYVRECVNHGSISAGSGGNKYDGSNRNAIHVGGVVAYAEARPDLRASVANCSNDGKVSCASGRKGDVIGNAVNVKTGGAAAQDYAVAVQPKADGTNIWGSVTTSDGKGLEGIVVTDGRQCVKTAADGSYSMTSDLSCTRFVYLSMPSYVEIPIREGRPQQFRRIPHDAKAATADFVLQTREPAKEYKVLMIADPQVRPYGWDDSMERWDDTVAPDAEAFRASCSGDVYSINLGDLVYNEMYAWDDYLDVAAKINCPTFNVIGNHDYDQNTLFEIEQGNVFFETYVGPEHYSFDLGDIHYVILNTIMYDRPSVNDKYKYGLDDRTLEWLKADLSYVPKNKIIMLCSHHNPFKTPNNSKHGSHNFHSRHYNEYLALVKDYKAVYAWNGHNHQNFYYNYANHIGKDTKHGAPNIQCISVARATGALRFNRPIGSKGEPQGYMVMNVHGEQVDWYYKGVGFGKDYQMKVYSPARTGDDKVKANIWNWSEGWSTPEWYENGVKVADMEFTPGIDPDYYDLFATYDNQTNRKYCQPDKNCIMFSVEPTPGATSGEVRVTDMFGNTYTQQVTL